MDIVFVGAGNAAVVMLNYFLQDEEVSVVGVVDPRSDAPGIIRARELNIHTTTDMKAMITQPNVGAVLELTGNAKVRREIIDLLRPDQDIMSAGAAKLMSEVLARVTEKNTGRVCDDLVQLTQQMDSAIDAVDRASVDIAKVLREIRVLALNGNVEAARAGHAGAAFAVVVEHMHELVDQVQGAVEHIGTSSQDSHAVLKNLQETEAHLRGNARQAL